MEWRLCFSFYWRLPKMPRHIYMTIGLEVDALGLKQRTLTTPTRGCAAFFIDYTMTGKRLGSWRIAKRAADHARMARPTCQGGDMTIGSHTSARYLAHDIQHGITKRPCLFRRHQIGIVLHTTAYFISFAICFPVASGNNLRKCSNIRSNDSCGVRLHWHMSRPNSDSGVVNNDQPQP